MRPDWHTYLDPRDPDYQEPQDQDIDTFDPPVDDAGLDDYFIALAQDNWERARGL